MESYQGKIAFQGIAIGKVIEIKRDDNLVHREKIQDVSKELQRFRDAQNKAILQLKKLYAKAEKEVGQANAAIFEVHQMMIEDDDYVDSIENIVNTQFVNAEYAVAATGDNFSQMFASMDDAYMKERAADVKDISNRLIRILSNTDMDASGLQEPSIIVADDLVPSETVQLDKNMVLAFVTRQGSVNSHTAILARTMNIPALVGVGVQENINGKTGIVNGFSGTFILNPGEKELSDAEEIKRQETEKKQLLLEYKGKKAVTKSGRKIQLYANIGGISDVGSALQNDAAGIGLFRSEFLYLQEKDYPSEEKQFQTYKQVAEMMAGKKVIIRTLDIGADKKIDYFELKEEENPALGYRAIRICLTREHIFKTQLRALYRASAFGNIAVMFPMITSVWEVEKVKEIMNQVKKELTEEGIPFGNMELGIMIETPAAVMISDELAEMVDFFSIGTNDLTQYTLAVDRQNPQLDMFYNSHHPAVLKMIKTTVDNAHKAGIWAGICGELGADISLTEQFMKMGVDELSVSPSMVLSVKKRICECE